MDVVESLSSKTKKPLQKRHYKKDSMFVLDLYTLCYDENETVDTVELFTSIVNNTAGNWTQQRRNDREEIRRRLAIGAGENGIELNKKSNPKPSIQTRLQNGFQIGRIREASPDTESHSSDSETCPKLSKCKPQSSMNLYGLRSNNEFTTEKSKQHLNRKHGKQHNQSETLVAISNEDKECEFFTKQAKLQIEARMALAQAKDMAHMQMEIDRQNQRISPITGIVRGALKRIGVQMTADKRRVSRQMLTEMSLGQLQVLVNNMHVHIERFNELLVHVLMERDDLHMAQDSILIDIEDLTRYIGMEENLEHQNGNGNNQLN